MGSFPSSLRPGFFARAESAVLLKLGWMLGVELATGEGGSGLASVKSLDVTANYRNMEERCRTGRNKTKKIVSINGFQNTRLRSVSASFCILLKTIPVSSQL